MMLNVLSNSVNATTILFKGLLQKYRFSQNTSTENEHTDLSGFSPIKFIKEHGYPVNIYTVETEDHYILTVFQIPHGKNQKDQKEKRHPILLMHGLLGSADNWIIAGENRALAFLLADEGYDVWLPSSRGTTFSNKHKHLNVQDQEYWDFSWHEIGYYDIPALLKFIVKETQNDSLTYIGHSQGIAALLVMCSDRPEMQKYIKFVIALAPAVLMKHHKMAVTKIFAKHINKVYSMCLSLKQYSFPILLPHDLVRWLSMNLCKRHWRLFEKLSYALFGHDKDQIDVDTMEKFFTTVPAGASMKQLVHYAQGINTGLFAHYDYGSVLNKQLYGVEKPPLYNLSNCKVPIVIFYGSNDNFAAIEDVHKLISLLPNVVKSILVNHSRFNHVDFLAAKDVVDLLYEDVIRWLRMFNDI